MPKDLAIGSTGGVFSSGPYTTVRARARIKEESPSSTPCLASSGSEPKQPTWSSSRSSQADDSALLNHASSSDDGRSLMNRTGAGNQPAERETRGSRTVARLAASHSLRQAERIIDELRTRISVLERSQKRFKKRASNQSESLKDLKEEGKGRLILLVEAESKLEELQHSLKAVREVADRYRHWWLAEYHSLKAVIQLIPPRHDVEAIASSSLERYRTYSNN